MITLSKIGKVSNLKERELRFPEDNQFTQPNAIQIKVNEFLKFRLEKFCSRKDFILSLN